MTLTLAFLFLALFVAPIVVCLAPMPQPTTARHHSIIRFPRATMPNQRVSAWSVRRQLSHMQRIHLDRCLTNTVTRHNVTGVVTHESVYFPGSHHVYARCDNGSGPFDVSLLALDDGQTVKRTRVGRLALEQYAMISHLAPMRQLADAGHVVYRDNNNRFCAAPNATFIEVYI